jgi:periplasmic divalent cation tolerance protein
MTSRALVAKPEHDASGGSGSVRLVLATAPDQAVAKRIALALLERRLVACVNVIAGVTSHYRWQGKLEEASEVLMVAKTSSDRLAALEIAFHELHPYDTPEFVVVAAEHVAPRYLAWLHEETR